MCKSRWSFNASSLVVIAVMASMFILPGNVSAGNDGRTVILLTEKERDAALAEMRELLKGVEAITVGLATKDMKTIATSARKVGIIAAQDVEISMKEKLPLAFKKLGLATHKAFDALANEAQGKGDAQLILTKLGELMNKCTTCHASYRIDVETKNSTQ